MKKIENGGGVGGGDSTSNSTCCKSCVATPQLDLLQELRREARRDLILECRKHGETKLLRSIPWLGPIRVAMLIGRVQTPHRFRTKRQFWAYCGLALETRSSADFGFVNGQLERRKKPVFIRGFKPEPQPRSEEPV